MARRHLIKDTIEDRLMATYRTVDNPFDNRPCFECDGLYFKIDTMGADFDGVVVEYADGAGEAEHNLFEDGDLFSVSEYEDDEKMIADVIKEIEREIKRSQG